MEFKIRASNLKMKSVQNPLSLGKVVGWNDLHPVVLVFNTVNIVLILLNTNISAEMLFQMNCGSFEMLWFSVVAVATTE